MSSDLSHSAEPVKKYHFIGIGGIGMSALARILLQRGKIVSGSDLAPSYVTDQLKAEGAIISFGHSENAVNDSPIVVYSTAVNDQNPEIKIAKENGWDLIHRSDLLFDLMEGYAPLLVTGTHGKTTTSSLLAHVLSQSNLNPSFAIGGIVRSLGANGGNGKGPYFVAEADESDGSFLKYRPFGAIITNIDNDHLDYWKTEEALIEGYHHFANRVTSNEHLIWCGDDEKLRSLNLKGVSYGFEEDNDICVANYQQIGWKNVFDLTFKGKEYPGIEVSLIGGHNVLNAAAVFGLGMLLNVSEDKLRSALASFQGVNRRMEKKGEAREIAIYDDYAHHPAEIFATLHAVKYAISHRRLVVVFQPHRYTRTHDCFAEFGPAFEPSNLLIVTDIFAAGEEPIAGVTTEALIAKIGDSSSVHLCYLPRKALAENLIPLLQPQDVVVTMGAGDITKLGTELLEKLR
ncbi:MAG: UDP-N-acetylmuramate--L-alanine ligase [Rhabdochlamydiaceae bacterium]|nr:UDP-N-acetylmuramate--L-alanine ligase [Rhabdochlamydiaceae bacterium]